MPAIATIIRNRLRSRLTPAPGLVGASLLGVCLVALGLPRIGLEATLLTMAPILAATEDGGLPAEDARQAAGDLTRLATRSGAPRAYALASRAWIAVADRRDASPALREQALTQALAAQTAGLALAPADQYGWQRLAHLLAERHQWIEATQAWEMSQRTGFFEPTLMDIKLESGIALWPYMTLAQRALFARLAATALETRPHALVALVIRHHAIAPVTQALAGTPDALRFTQALAQWRP